MKRHFFLAALLISMLLMLFACENSSNKVAIKFEDSFLQGDYAYVTFERDLLTVDVSDPFQPKIISRIGLKSKVVAIAINGKALYVGLSADSAYEGQTKTDGGVFKYDISSSTPEFEKQLAFPAFVRTLAADSNHLESV